MMTFLMIMMLVLALALLFVHRDERSTRRYAESIVEGVNTNTDNTVSWLNSHKSKIKGLGEFLNIKWDKVTGTWRQDGLMPTVNAQVPKNGMKYIDGPNGWVPVNPAKSKKSKKK